LICQITEVFAIQIGSNIILEHTQGNIQSVKSWKEKKKKIYLKRNLQWQSRILHPTLPCKENEKEVNSDKEKLGLFSVEKLQVIIIPAWAC